MEDKEEDKVEEKEEEKVEEKEEVRASRCCYNPLLCGQGSRAERGLLDESEQGDGATVHHDGKHSSTL